ncbi:MAG: CsbD family protein [Candidatus Dormibacteraceae bacterium]
MKDQIEGKVEEVHGKMTGDKGEEVKGKARQAVDKVKRTGRDVRDDVRDEADKNEREREAETARERGA